MTLMHRIFNYDTYLDNDCIFIDISTDPVSICTCMHIIADSKIRGVKLLSCIKGVCRYVSTQMDI